MSLAVFRRSLFEARWILGGLGLALAGFSALLTAIFPSFRAQAALVERLLPSFVRMLLTAAPIDRPEGFLSWAFQHPVWLALALAWPIAAAGSAIAGEIERGTLAWVLATPVSRTGYFSARALAIVLGEALVVGAGAAAFGIGSWRLGDLPAGGGRGILLAAVEAWLLFVAIGSICLAVSALTREAGRVYAFGIGFSAASQILSLLAQMWAPARAIVGISLFAYFRPFDALAGHAVRATSFCVPLGVSVVALLAGWQAFKRRALAI